MIRKRLSSLVCVCVLSSGLMAGEVERVLRFDEPARRFTGSCPLGNGRLGAMVFGGVQSETVVLNESGMWSGSRQQADRPNAHEALPEIRRLLLEGKNHEAEELVNQTFTCAGAGSGFGGGKSVPYGCYQTLGLLRLEMRRPEGEPTEYHRELSLADAQASIGYKIGDTTFTRQALVSAPDEVFVYRLAAEGADGQAADALSLVVWLERPERAEITPHGDDTLEMHGQLEDGFEGDAGVRYAARLQIISQGGVVTQEGDKLRVDGAHEVLLLVTAATVTDSFAGRGIDDARRAAERDLQRAAEWSFDNLAERQAAHHRRLFDRVQLRIGEPSRAPLSERVSPTQPADADLVATLFDYGRYLLIGSSRPGGFPANLQGIWAEEIQTPWNGDWHANVNIQMNYWPAESCGLSELHQPLFALVDSLVEPGGVTARSYYNARGWVAHLLLNPWGYTSPGESASWGSTPTCSAWMCQHLWDHYLFTGDREHLEAVYPILRGAAAFYADMLIEEPEHGWLVTAPSNSPENAFIDAEGRQTHTCMGPAMDQQLLRYLFDAVIIAAQLLERDDPLVAELQEKRTRLAPTQIGADGRVMEWLQEREEADPTHRHISQLWGLYPGHEIDRHATPDLAAAARKSLDRRGDGGTGWAIAHKACLWARLGDGDRALELLQRLLRPAAGRRDRENQWRGGVYANLFVAHPPFQIDGNFGATAAVAEMLLQSRYENPVGGAPPEIELLPALPAAWSEGYVHGLQTRGGVTVDIAWSKGRLTSASLTSAWASSAVVRYGEREQRIELPQGESVSVRFE